MNLKNFFQTLIMIFSIFAITSIVIPSVSSAEDVWILSRGGYDYYMVTDTIRKGERGYGVNVKLVADARLWNFRVLSFSSVNDLYMVMEEFTKYDGKWTVSSDDELGAPLWEAMKPYMKAKGISYPNLNYK